MKFLNKYNLIYEYEDSPELNICITINTQIIKNQFPYRGVPHLIEHILLKRLKTHLSKIDCRSYAETNNIYTYYTIRGPISDLDLVISSLNIIINPTPIDNIEIENEVQGIINENETKIKNSLYLFNKEICKKYYNNCMGILEIENITSNINLEEINNYLLKEYEENNILIKAKGNKDLYEKLKDLSNLDTNKDITIYYNENFVSIYYNIDGISSNIFYLFFIFKIMVLNELYSKYKNLEVKIIRTNIKASYFLVRCWYRNKNMKNELFLDIKNIISNVDLYIRYSKKLYNTLLKKLNNSEYKTCLTSILYL